MDSLFFSTFVGNNVFITTNVTQTNRLQLPEGLLTESLPMFFEGILMDLDDEYLFLGDGKSVSNAVRKEFILQIELKEEEDKFKKLLESVNPRNDTEFN
jgi:hypothetical protein